MSAQHLPKPRHHSSMQAWSKHCYRSCGSAQSCQIATCEGAHLQADALTTAELSHFRQLVKDRLEEAASKVGRPIMHQFSAEDIERAGRRPVLLIPQFCLPRHLCMLYHHLVAAEGEGVWAISIANCTAAKFIFLVARLWLQ